MSSVLPPTQMARSCNGCLNQSSRKIEQLTGMYMSDDSQKSNSTFLGMTGRKRKNKKRPPPISISAGSVKDFMAGNTFNSRSFHDGYWTPPTPQTPPQVPCMKQLCKEVHDYLIATPTLSQPKHHPDHIWPPRIKSSIMSSAELPAELPTNPSAEIAELPGSEPSQQHAEQLHELDASSPSSTSTCVKIEKPDITPSDTPELSPSSTTGSTMEAAFWAFPSRPTKSVEPVKNGKLLSLLKIDELLDVFPELSPLEIEEHWRPLVARECNIMKETLKEYHRQELQRLQNPNPNPQVVYKSETPEEAKERRKSEHILETTRVEKECENRLNEKDAELLTLKTAYESNAAILSTFIDRYHDLNHSTDPYAPSIRDLVNKHSMIRERATNPGTNGEFIYVSEKEHTERTLELEMFRFQLDDLDRLVNYYEDKAKKFAAQNKSLEKEVKQYKKDEFQHAKEIVDKNLQIASLNLKNAQMMKTHPPYSHHGSHSGGLGDSAMYGNASDWKKYEDMEERLKEEVKKKERDAAVLRYKEEMMARLPGYVTKSVDFSVPRFGASAAAPSAMDNITNRLETLNVEGERFPFYMGDN